ncbi:MAG: LPS-assembly protein LptD [Selenomonadaceae bacterium]|nr:LPS-assembly protein LptD [Selenomonadaceae bacterium]
MKKFLGVVCAALFITSNAEAVYDARSDTGTEFFNYIENRRREEREQKLTEEQEKLLADIAEAKEQLPQEPKEGDRVPAIFEGDDLVYYSGSGEFIATGKVDIIQLDGYRFQSDEASGNLKEEVVRVDGKAHFLQLMPGTPRVTLDGFKTVYNYGNKTGSMGAADGKVGEYYLTGKRFEFYPDHIVVYNGTQTKCGAKNPDYHVRAERMEIWPEQVMKMYKVEFLVKGNVVGSRDYLERKFEEEGENYFPRVGYNSNHGFYIRDDFKIPLREHLNWVIGAYIETKKGFRSNTELRYKNRTFDGRIKYGFYRDGNSRWIQKEPSLNLYYDQHLMDLPLSYSLEAEFGHWRQNSISSTHGEYEAKLYHDPINIGRYLLFMDVGYKVTNDDTKKVEHGDTTVRGMNWDILIGREFNRKFSAYVGYSYEKNNSQNSVFDFDLDDFSKKIRAGISYTLTPKDRIVVGYKINADNHRMDDIDYYWYHDLHCSQAVFRWRAKRHKFEVHWEFVPW